jgi:hypothetical protein
VAKKPVAKKVAPKAVAKKPITKKVAPKAVAKKPVAKKVAPKAVAKKPVAKKVAPKAVAKKPVAKKVAPKAVAKKPITKKVAPKAVAKKPVAKKVAPKAVAKKPVAKKVAPKVVAKKLIQKATNKKDIKGVSKKSVTPVLKKNIIKPAQKATKKEVIKKDTKKALPKAQDKKKILDTKKATIKNKVVETKKTTPISKIKSSVEVKPAVVPVKKAIKEDTSSKAKLHIEHEDVSTKPVMMLSKDIKDIKGTIVSVVKPKLNREEKKALKEKLRLKAQAQKKASGVKINYAEVRRLARIKAQAEIDAYLKANPKRRLLKLEFVIRSSPTILYTFLKSSSCLALWFCDVCSENGNDYSFTWNGDTQYATMVEDHEDESVKYKWVGAPKEEFIEFSISKSEISFDTILTIKEFIDAGDEASQSVLWEEQVKSLLKHIGG